MVVEWCRCEQRPPQSGDDLCAICREFAKDGPLTPPIETQGDPNPAAFVVGLSCLAFAASICILVGWMLRGWVEW